MTCSSPVRLFWDVQADRQGGLLSLVAENQALKRSKHVVVLLTQAQGHSRGQELHGGARRFLTPRMAGAHHLAGATHLTRRTTSPRSGACRAWISTVMTRITISLISGTWQGASTVRCPPYDAPCTTSWWDGSTEGWLANKRFGWVSLSVLGWWLFETVSMAMLSLRCTVWHLFNCVEGRWVLWTMGIILRFVQVRV